MLHARQLDLLASSYADTDGHAVSHNLFSPLKPIVSAQDDSNNNRPPFPQPTAIDNREINSVWSKTKPSVYGTWYDQRRKCHCSLLSRVAPWSYWLYVLLCSISLSCSCVPKTKRDTRNTIK
ncbi:hypothetical protein BRADI_3g27541v3 [Brachypodium distachyon]|uniref:Uncharacterized protein n=1 Tax=Brachypodium distachyon TaxID=15368 RepID=A0A0Q3HTL1_BRADI|nr:hypothetical protein BRADI_3g27541v3 [Brachypodium distachyon]